MTPPRILVTNDDGIGSPGLHALTRRLSSMGEVTVFAPSGNMSGASAAIGHIGPGIPDVFDAACDDLGDVRAAHHFDAPPALAVLLVCSGLLGDLPDVVVSGINPGWNVGHAVHFSGTIGACITADVFGVPGIAVSQRSAEPGGSQQWETAAGVAASLLSDVVARPRVLSVNVPNLAPDALAGVTETRLSDRIPYGLHAATLSPVADGRAQVGFERFGPHDSSNGTDTHAVENGWVSVTELVPTGDRRRAGTVRHPPTPGG